MKILFALVAAAAIMIPSAAKADRFDFSYTGNDGTTITGTLNANPIGHNEFSIASGSILVAGPTALDGAGTFVPDPGTGVFQTGGGTELILDGTDDNLFFPSGGNGQYIDDTGVWLFQMQSGLGLGIFSNEPNAAGYGAFGGNWQLNDSGNLVLSQVTPEPRSLFLLGTGWLFLAFASFKLKERASARGAIQRIA